MTISSRQPHWTASTIFVSTYQMMYLGLCLYDGLRF